MPDVTRPDIKGMRLRLDERDDDFRESGLGIANQESVIAWALHLEMLIRQQEWAAYDTYRYRCHWCHGYKHPDGHESGCPILPILNSTDPEAPA